MVKDAESVHIPGKTGPKPKTLEPFEKMGIAVGRDNLVIDPLDIQKLAALGCNLKEISDFFGAKPDTIKRNFADYIQKGQSELHISLRRAMITNATQNMNATIQIWLSKNMLGMRDDPTHTDEVKPLPWVERKPIQEASAVIGKTSDLQIII
jgi:hypothetical protein